MFFICQIGEGKRETLELCEVCFQTMSKDAPKSEREWTCYNPLED